MTAVADDAEARERWAVEADLAAALCEYVTDRPYPLSLGGGKFRPLYLEEAEELGCRDDEVILIRRESDGAVFEVDVDVTVRPVPAEAERAEAAGQLALLPGKEAGRG